MSLDEERLCHLGPSVCGVYDVVWLKARIEGEGQGIRHEGVTLGVILAGRGRRLLDVARLVTKQNPVE